MDKKLVYMTYQSFPAQTANSIQTMTHIKYFSKLGYAVSLIFPLRNKESNANCNMLQKFYEFHDFVIARRGFADAEGNAWASNKEQLADITYEWKRVTKIDKD